MKCALSKTFFATCALLCGSLNALAGNLKAPIDLKSAKVLPQSVRNMRYKAVWMMAQDKYNNGRLGVGVAEPMIKNVTWNDVFDTKVDPFAKGGLKGFVDKKNSENPGRYDYNASLGTTRAEVGITSVAHVAAFAIGLTDRLTMGMAIPYVDYEMVVETGFEANEAEFKKVEEDFKDEENYDQLGKFSHGIRNPIEKKARDFNYAELRNEKGRKLADMKLLTKYQWYRGDEVTLTFENTITAPTGKTADINKLVDVPTGDGQWDVGFGMVSEWQPTEAVTLVGAMEYTHQLKDTIATRVPYRQDSKATPSTDIDYNTKRKLGAIMGLQVGANFETPLLVKFNTSYDFLHKREDRHSGSVLPPEHYSYLNQDTAQTMHVVRAGISYDTLKLFQQKKFKVPLSVSLAQSLVVSGKNVIRDPTTSFEFSLFF